MSRWRDRLSLRFSPAVEAELPGIEAAFREEHDRASVARVRAAAALLAGVYASYIPATVLFDFGPAFARVRAPAVGLEAFGLLVTLTFVAFTLRAEFWRSLQPITAFTAFLIGAQASAVSLLFPHPYDYVALSSVMLVILCVFTVIRLRFAPATCAGLGIVAAFSVEAATFGKLGGLAAIQLGFYLFTGNLIGVLAAYWIERTLRHDFLQTQRLARERERSERLLLNVLPASIAERLKAGEEPIADSLPEVTVLFADIVGFTQLSSRTSPEELVAILNELFRRFDALAERHGLEKIKTIGDAYMAAAGLPTPQPDHAARAADMALGLLAAIEDLNRERGWGLGVRVGLHSGPLVAGVIGKQKFSYDVWGDTVNTASRMESHGAPGKVQVSAATQAYLEGAFVLEGRGELEVKGKGPMRTWFLTGRRPTGAEAASSSEGTDLTDRARADTVPR